MFKQTSKDTASITTEVFTQIKPIVIVGRLFGLYPISCEGNVTGYVLKRSWIFVILGIVVALINVPWTVWGTIDEILTDPPYRSLRMTDPKRRFITCMDLYSIIVPGLYVMFVSPFKLRHFWKILRGLQDIDLILPCTTPKNDQRGFIKVITLLFLFLTFIMAHEVVMWMRIKLLTRDLYHYMPFHFTYYVLLVYKLQYWVMVGMITTRIRAINERLVSLTENSEIKRDGDENPMTFSGCYYEIQDIIRAEDKIRDVVDEINTCSFLHLVLTLYFMFEVKEWTTLLTTYIQVVWVVTHIIRLLTIVEACQRCLDENEKTAKLAIKLLIREQDDTTKDRIKVLLMKVAQKELKFTAYSVPEIDRSFVTDMFCSIASYLVVMLQFNVE